MVVVVEPNPEEQVLIVRAVKAVGLPTFRVASRPEEVVEMLVDAKEPKVPGFVLMDIDDRWHLALETVQKVRADKRVGSVPVVCITDHHEPKRVREVYEAGANVVLAKPVDYEEYQQMIRFVCRFWLQMALSPYERTMRLGSAVVTQPVHADLPAEEGIPGSEIPA